MKLSSKITDLKNQLGSNYSSFAQTLDSTSKGVNIRNNDYANAVVDALRKIGKEVQMWKKSVLIPLEPNKRFYSVYISHYTKELIDYVKPAQLAFVGFNTSGEMTVGQIKTETWESIERNQFIDSFYFGNKFFGSEIAFKSSSLFTNEVSGALDALAATPTTTSISVSSSITAGKIIYNLEFAERLYQWYATALTTGTTPTIDLNAGTAGWLISDKLWVADGLSSFMLFTFQAIPQLDYFKTLTTSTLEIDIPILSQYEDDITDIALNYLYKILLARNPEFAGTYVSMAKLGLIKETSSIISKIKARAVSIDTPVVQGYNPLGQRYGR